MEKRLEREKWRVRRKLERVEKGRDIRKKGEMYGFEGIVNMVLPLLNKKKTAKLPKVNQIEL